MLKYRLYDGNPLPANLEGFMKAGANIGSVIGQFAFGEDIYPTFRLQIVLTVLGIKGILRTL